jgi:hypothetical protein
MSLNDCGDMTISTSDRGDMNVGTGYWGNIVVAGNCGDR